MVISEETLKARALFSQRLGILLNEHDMKQNELAALLGVSESTVGKWMLGKSMPRTMGLVQKIADHFGVGKSYLLESDPAPKKEIALSQHDRRMVEAYHRASDKDKYTVDMVLNEYSDDDLPALAEKEKEELELDFVG